MTGELYWDFVVDTKGRARLVRASALAAVETVVPGEYLVTLPVSMDRELGFVANVGDDAGFISAAPGDDDGNKPNTLRILTMLADNTFGPRPFTLVVRQA